MSPKNGPLEPCLAGCGYSVPANKRGEPHKIVVDGKMVECPGR